MIDEETLRKLGKQAVEFEREYEEKYGEPVPDIFAVPPPSPRGSPRVLEYVAALGNTLEQAADESAEDRLLDGMDTLWYAMKPEERELIDDFLLTICMDPAPYIERMKTDPRELLDEILDEV